MNFIKKLCEKMWDWIFKTILIISFLFTVYITAVLSYKYLRYEDILPLLTFFISSLSITIILHLDQVKASVGKDKSQIKLFVFVIFLGFATLSSFILYKCIDNKKDLLKETINLLTIFVIIWASRSRWFDKLLADFINKKLDATTEEQRQKAKTNEEKTKEKLEEKPEEKLKITLMEKLKIVLKEKLWVRRKEITKSPEKSK